MNEIIAFIGLGNMGGPMAVNLKNAGFKVHGVDISDANRAAAARNGIAAGASVAEAINGAAAVITMLPTGKHVKSVWAEILSTVKPGTLLIDCSTIEVEVAVHLHAAGGQHGCLTLDAPVSGGVGGATAGSLTFMVGASQPAFDRASAILQAMGKRIVRCGDAGAGQTAKVCNNMVLGITMAGVAEAFVLGEKLGLSHQALYDVLSTSSGQCWAVTTYCPVPGPVPTSPANNDYKPGFAGALMLKDLRLAQSAAQSVGSPTPVGAVASQLYELFGQLGYGGEDFSAIIKLLRGALTDEGSRS